MTRLSVLFLTRYPIEGASSRYRVFQYVEHLRSLGIECKIQSYMDASMYRLSFTPGRTLAKVRSTIVATCRRLSAILRHGQFDVVYMQRELLPFGPPIVEHWLKRKGAKLVFDYDDALFISKPSRYNPIASFLRSPAKVFKVFGIVDLVIAGNDWLRDQAIAHGASAVTLEVGESTRRIPMHSAHNSGRPVTIGWLGSSSTVKYLRLIEPTLRNIARDYPSVLWEIVGGGAFAMDGVPWRHTEWSMDAELSALQRFDIGLMPLPDEDWARGKSGGKARTYMAAGVVPICSAIGYNLELIDHGRTGLLCRTLGDWHDAIAKSIKDPGFRQDIATAARREVEARFDPLCQARKLAGLLRSVASHRAEGQ